MKKLFSRVYAQLSSKRAFIIYGLIVVVFLLLNISLGYIYKNKTYPNTLVSGQDISGISHDILNSKLKNLELLPETVTLKFHDHKTQISANELGIQIDAEATAQTILNARSWLPILNIMFSRNVSFSSTTDDEKIQDFAQSLSNKHKQAATNARITLKDGKFSILSEKKGYKLEIDYVKNVISTEIARGSSVIDLKPIIIEAKVTKDQLEKRLRQLQKQQQTTLTLKFGNKSKTFTSTEIANMFDANNGRVELADTNIQAAVIQTGQNFGILVENTTQITKDISQAITNNEDRTLTLIEKPRPTLHYTYCVAARGVSTSYLDNLSSKLAGVFADGRGWGLNKQVLLNQVPSGCNFTVWLSAASQMPTFGSICDSNWSCRVGSNVVINFDRWQGATTSWNNAGGSLENYRIMVINHEVGHWFGYYHAYCGGAGQLAPVMQQQSINLQGCKFNPWPTASELAHHRHSLGI